MNAAISLDGMSYEQWLDFVFDHPAAPYDLAELPAMNEPWYFEERWQYTMSGAIAIERLVKLFRAPEVLLSRYTVEQIDQGFWFIPGPYGLMWAILDESVAWDSRKSCIESIELLVSRLLCTLPAGTACIMWWDSVFSYCTYRNKDLGTDLAVLSEIARCIVTIAHLNQANAREMAQHGIEHLGKLSRSTDSVEIRSLYAQTIADARLEAT